VLFSKIIDFKSESAFFDLCGFPKNQKWSLLYRASEHGFLPKDFHSKCDDKSNTLTIIKSSNGYVFGGYTSFEWEPIQIYIDNDSDEYDSEEYNSDDDEYDDNYGYEGYALKSDPEMFIFSFVNKANTPLKYTECKSIYCDPSYGPAFGSNGVELALTKGSNKVMNGASYLSKTKGLPDGYKHSSFLNGSNEIKAVEVEVYLKLLS
jgi:hypothetical protein